LTGRAHAVLAARADLATAAAVVRVVGGVHTHARIAAGDVAHDAIEVAATVSGITCVSGIACVTSVARISGIACVSGVARVTRIAGVDLAGMGGVAAAIASIDPAVARLADGDSAALHGADGAFGTDRGVGVAALERCSAAGEQSTHRQQ
jgi:hypothetical protein